MIEMTSFILTTNKSVRCLKKQKPKGKSGEFGLNKKELPILAFKFRWDDGLIFGARKPGFGQTTNQTTRRPLTSSPAYSGNRANAVDNSIAVNSRYNGEFAAELSGGERQGADFTGKLNLGADFDLTSWSAWKEEQSVLFTDRAAIILPTSPSIVASPFSRLWRWPDLSADDVHVRAEAVQRRRRHHGGRTDIFDDFVASPLYCDFQSNAACGNPSFAGNGRRYRIVLLSRRRLGRQRPVQRDQEYLFEDRHFPRRPNPTPIAGHGFNWGGPTDGAQGAAEVGYATTHGVQRNQTNTMSALSCRARILQLLVIIPNLPNQFRQEFRLCPGAENALPAHGQIPPKASMLSRWA